MVGDVNELLEAPDLAVPVAEPLRGAPAELEQDALLVDALGERERRLHGLHEHEHPRPLLYLRAPGRDAEDRIGIILESCSGELAVPRERLDIHQETVRRFEGLVELADVRAQTTV